jgi:DHA2 family multidrug resistance protein
MIPYFFLAGFTLLLIYHLWMYRIFSTDLSFGDLAGPVILQGAASGMLFVPIIVMMVAKLPPYTGFTGATLGSFTRFQATINGIAGFYTLQLYYNQQYKEGFLRHLSTLDDPFVQRLGQYAAVFRVGGYTAEQSNMLATASVSRALTVQSQLLTNMAVFKVMSVIIVCVLVLLVAVLLLLRLKRTRS